MRLVYEYDRYRGQTPIMGIHNGQPIPAFLVFRIVFLPQRMSTLRSPSISRSLLSLSPIILHPSSIPTDILPGTGRVVKRKQPACRVIRICHAHAVGVAPEVRSRYHPVWGHYLPYAGSAFSTQATLLSVNSETIRGHVLFFRSRGGVYSWKAGGGHLPISLIRTDGMVRGTHPTPVHRFRRFTQIGLHHHGGAQDRTGSSFVALCLGARTRGGRSIALSSRRAVCILSCTTALGVPSRATPRNHGSTPKTR